jgi:hypothetical protein
MKIEIARRKRTRYIKGGNQNPKKSRKDRHYNGQKKKDKRY